jgi:hypothetical protein
MGQSKYSTLFEMVKAIRGDILKHLRSSVRPENFNLIHTRGVSESEVQA